MSLRVLVPMLAAAAATAAVTGDPVLERLGLYEIAKLPLRPLGSGNVADGAVEVHPWALATAGYDAGLQTGDASFALGRLGGIGRWRDGDSLLVAVDADVGARFYGGGSALGGRPLWDTEARFSRRPAAGGLLIDAKAATKQEDNAPLRLDELVGTREWSAEGRAGWKGASTDISLRGGYLRRIWLDDTIYYGAEEHDLAETSLEASAGVALGPKTRLSLAASTTRTVYDLDTVFQDGTGVEGSLGCRWEFGARSSASLRLGWEEWRYADDFRQDVLRDDDAAAGPTASADVMWSWEHLSFAAVGYTHGLGPSETSNAAVIDALAASARLRLTEGLGIWTRIEATRIDDIADASSGDPPPEATRSLDSFLVLDWGWRKGMALRPRASYRVSTGEDRPVSRHVVADVTVVVMW